jgi:hypothetical protein
MMTNIKVVDSGAFGMPDMYRQEEEVTTYTVEVTTYPGTTETFTHVTSADIHDNFLKIVQVGCVTSFNTADVSRTVAYEDR